MPGYHFFRSEEQHYSLGEVDLPRAREITTDLVKRVREARKIDEAIALMIDYDGHYFNASSKNGEYLAFGAYLRALKDKQSFLEVKTELVYTDRQGKLMAAVVTVDDEDIKLAVPISLFNLASFKRQDQEVLFTIHPLHQIGVNPQFLYDFGQRHGRKTK